MKKITKIMFQHETHRHIWLKFLSVIILFLIYFIFISMQYGIEKGFFISWLMWSFFVLCTPIADAGFLIDFPLRIITNTRMLFAEIFVWIFAILLNIYAYFFQAEIYEKTKILFLFKHIIEQPFPYWIIIILSAIGTFLSVKFGDELFDIFHHKDRKFYQKHNLIWKGISMIFIFILVIIVYDFLLKKLGVNIPL